MGDDIKLVDSGERREAATGSRRDVREGKGRFDLIPYHPTFLLARQFEEGAKKYGERNWELGQPLSWYLDSAQRHGAKHVGGETDERHDVAAFWNWCAYLATKQWIEEGKLPRTLDDVGHCAPIGELPPIEAFRQPPSFAFGGASLGAPVRTEQEVDDAVQRLATKMKEASAARAAKLAKPAKRAK